MMNESYEIALLAPVSEFFVSHFVDAANSNVKIFKEWRYFGRIFDRHSMSKRNWIFTKKRNL
jgi:hypothetical protein